MAELQVNKKVLIWSSVILLVGLGGFFLARKAKAGELPDEITGLIPGGKKAGNTNIPDDIVITDHDRDYDYKYKNGIWYSRRKGTNMWIDMQQSLSAENYQTAVQRLENHVSRKNLNKQLYAS